MLRGHPSLLAEIQVELTGIPPRLPAWSTKSAPLEELVVNSELFGAPFETVLGRLDGVRGVSLLRPCGDAQYSVRAAHGTQRTDGVPELQPRCVFRSSIPTY